MGHIHPKYQAVFFKKLIIPVYGMALWYEIFWPKKSTKKSSFFGGHGDKKLHFFTKNGRNVTWMGSNGYIMHITYLNYVDISPAEPQKIDFQGVQNCKKWRKSEKMTIFWSKYFSQKIEFYY